MWKYKREEREFEEIPEGTYRVAIASAEMAVSKASGNDMLVLRLAVSGYTASIWNYIAFLPDRPEVTNGMLTSLFDSFGIEEGDFNLAGYVGKVGAAKIKHDADGRAKISYFLKKDKQSSLPPWKGNLPEPIQGAGDPFEGDDDKIPF